MDPLTAARAQMEVSLGFHMIFAALGIGMPLLMVISEGLWLRTGQEHYRALAKKWAKSTALTFAVGAVSGTALSFELGLLWPRFMEFAGPIIGSAFALEGYAFFIEAIFLGLYLYGWERLSPRAHWLTGIPVAVSGMMSGVLVVAANAWMQTPVGFDVVDGAAMNIDPLAPFRAPAWGEMLVHSTLSCYVATGFAVAGVYAAGMLRGRRDSYHRAAVTMAMLVGGVAALLQPISGDFSARSVAEHQPAKLAAMEALFETRAGAPLLIGGIPDAEAGTVRWGIEVPKLLSLLAHHDPDAVVQGLEEFPRDEWPNVLITHLAFQVMVGCGTLLVLVTLWFWLAGPRLRWAPWLEGKRLGREARPMLLALLAAAPLGFVALEAGWIVTEVGRQPWVIYEVMRTSEGVTPVGDVPATFWGFTVLYLALGTALVALLRGLATGGEEAADAA